MSQTVYEHYFDPCYRFVFYSVFLFVCAMCMHCGQIAFYFSSCTSSDLPSLNSSVFHSLALVVAIPYECHSMLFHSDISFGQCSALVPFPPFPALGIPRQPEKHRASQFSHCITIAYVLRNANANTNENESIRSWMAELRTSSRQRKLRWWGREGVEAVE